MRRRIARFAARAALLAIFWWLPWAHAFGRDPTVFRASPWLGVVPAAVALTQGILASLVLAWIEKRSRREVDVLWLFRERPRLELRGATEASVDRRVACPWCGGVALSRRAKATMGPAVRAPCAACGKPVSVSAKPALAMLLGNVAALAMLRANPWNRDLWVGWVAIVPIAVGVVVAFVVNDRMPLVRR